MPDARLHMLISGRVQGVWYRATTRTVAAGLRLVGFARNLPDGRVEVLAEGPRTQLEELRAFCRRGPPLARVDEVQESWSEPTGAYRGFETR